LQVFVDRTAYKVSAEARSHTASNFVHRGDS
jgi:hypothetical protein